MNQTTKRIYGTLVGVAFLSGLTGAFAFSAFSHVTSEKNNFFADKELVVKGDEHVDRDIMSLSPSHSTPSQPVDLTEAAEKASEAVVYIKVTMGGKTETIDYVDPFEEFFGDFFGQRRGGTQRRQVQTPKRQAAGSGVIISNDGYIVTNNHVVEDADDIQITLNDNREFTARVVGLDPDTDLALLKIDGENLPSLVIGDSEALKVGEWVLAVGNPVGLNTTVTAGIVSAKARNLGAASSRDDVKTRIQSFIQTDAAINQGNSGGALVNVRGELIGINAMLYSQTGSYIGYGFAIPTTIVKKVVSDLKNYGTVQRAMFGIQGMSLLDYIDAQKAKDEKFKADFGTNDGVYVAEVVEEGAAAAAGLKSGDVIIDVDGKKITKMSELQESTTKYAPGDKAQVTVLRDKKKQTFTITFRNAKGTTSVVKTTTIDTLGAEFKELTDSQKKSLNLSNGVQIASIKSGKLAEAGIPKDFIIRKVNGQTIKTVKDLEQIFKVAQNSEDQTLWIWGQTPAGKQMSYAVQLGE